MPLAGPAFHGPGRGRLVETAGSTRAASTHVLDPGGQGLAVLSEDIVHPGGAWQVVGANHHQLPEADPDERSQECPHHALRSSRDGASGARGGVERDGRPGRVRGQYARRAQVARPFPQRRRCIGLQTRGSAPHPGSAHDSVDELNMAELCLRQLDFSTDGRSRSMPCGIEPDHDPDIRARYVGRRADMPRAVF